MARPRRDAAIYRRATQCRYCEIAAQRLSQGVLNLEAV